ncbi:MAG: hypothetical protein ACYSUQ_04315 [Planctomycetota bacterium]
MMRQVAQYGVVGLVAGLVLASVGCSSPAGSSTRIRMQTLCSAGLDECREIELTYDRLRDREAGEPQRAYELLRIVVQPRQQLSFEQTVKTVELKFGVPRGQCRFENVEARRDETGQKVWFVQRDTSRIVATLNLQTHETTGPDDEPPAWATPDGGEPLESAAE